MGLPGWFLTAPWPRYVCDSSLALSFFDSAAAPLLPSPPLPMFAAAPAAAAVRSGRMSQLGGLVWTGAAKSGEVLKSGAVKGGQLAYHGAVKSKQMVQEHPKAALIVGCGVGAVVAAPVALAAAGFGAGGVVGGTAATVVQSTYYGAATSGVFSVLQSVGAVGLGVKGAAAVGAAGAAIGAAIGSVIPERRPLIAAKLESDTKGTSVQAFWTTPMLSAITSAGAAGIGATGTAVAAATGAAAGAGIARLTSKL